MWIKEIVYGTINGGPHAGVMAFHIKIGNDEPQDGEIAEAIMKIRSFKSGALRVIRIYGEFPKANDAAVMTLLTPLKNYGYMIIAEVPRDSYRQWYSFPIKDASGASRPLVDWLVVKVNDEPWPAFNCSEIRYLLDKESSMSPILPENVEQIRLFVQPLTATPSQTIRFVQSSDQKWSIFLESKKNIRTSLYSEDEEEEE